MTTGAMMAYSPVSAAVGTDTRGPVIDWRFGRLYQAGGAPDGLRYFDFYPNGVEIRARANTDIGVVSTSGPYTMCYNAQLLAAVNGPSNGSAIFYLNPADFSLMATFGKVSADGTNSQTNIASPTCMVSIQNGSGQDIIISNSLFTDGALNAIQVGGLNTPLGTVDENHTVLGAVPDGSGLIAYAIGYTKLGGATQIGLYSLPVHSALPYAVPVITSIAKILPASIDAAWSHIDNVAGIAIDQTDGNLIAAIRNNTDSPTHPCYIVKINATTGAIMWKLVIQNAWNGDGDDDLKQSFITRQVLYYLDFSGNVFTINTATGASTSTLLDTSLVGPLHSAQVSEDVTGSVIYYGSWSEGATHPAYLGDYCLTQGHHSGSGLVWRFFPAGAPNPYLPTYGAPAMSRRRAWSFARDGHVFYVLDLGGQGTFLYDVSTAQWSKFITTGFNGWNLTNGTMWGTQRIVGGDYLNTNLWEMRPGALKDNDTLDITHVVTGGLVKRSRVYSSLEAVRLNCSFGQLAATFTATVLLEYSDDQGVTFTAADTLTVTEGDFSGEVAWRSLGSFAAPGRVFRITDVGAFLRIDGADGFLDNFDEDIPQPSTGA